jgi:hypothetical protein
MGIPLQIGAAPRMEWPPSIYAFCWIPGPIFLGEGDSRQSLTKKETKGEEGMHRDDATWACNGLRVDGEVRGGGKERLSYDVVDCLKFIKPACSEFASPFLSLPGDRDSFCDWRALCDRTCSSATCGPIRRANLPSYDRTV